MYVRYALFNIHVIYARYDIGKKRYNLPYYRPRRPGWGVEV